MESIFDNLDDIIVPKYYESQPFVFKEPDVDISALKMEFFNVYINNEIFYQNKIKQLELQVNGLLEINFKLTQVITGLKEKNK